jgi:uncharacterized protein (TIGR02996 family)
MDSAFLTAIQASPGESLPRLVYADWLEERGEDRHELVRLLEQVRPDVEAGEVPEADVWEAFKETAAREWPPGTERALLYQIERHERPLSRYRVLACDLAERGVDAWARHEDDVVPRRWLHAGRQHAAGAVDDDRLREVWREVTAARDNARHRLTRVAWPLSAALEPWRNGTAATRGVRATWLYLGPLIEPRELHAEERRRLVRHVEYALDFVGLPTPDAPQPG